MSGEKDRKNFQGWWRNFRSGVYEIDYAKYVSPHVTEIDLSDHVAEINGPRLAAFIGVADKGLVNTPKYYTPSIAPIRWWQFWRWHKIFQYRRECKKVFQDFIKDHGMPLPSDEYSKLAAKFIHDSCPWLRKEDS